MRTIELLSPARTADIGIEAIRHGADAVYIGAKAFGARAAAGNSVEDIARLVDFAHQYRARVYVTVNTIIYNNELAEVERLIWQLWDIHVDALIIQDLKLLTLNLPPIPLHASTQMDNRTVEKVQQLASLGFPQVVLARELTVDEISAIHSACPDTELEVFVHGALCVCLSGRCNASEALFRRSANRGECAQVCRMKFELLSDSNPLPLGGGRERGFGGSYYLSLKDNCQLDNLETLLQAGASSFKIEGRLKDVDYVKNVTAAYSEALNAIVEKYPDKYCRRASGSVSYTFKPDVRKSFNRGFVADVSKPDANLSTPKAMGEPIGKVREVFTTHFTIRPLSQPSPYMGREYHPDGSPHKGGYRSLRDAFEERYAQRAEGVSISNGDGLCYLHRGELIGFRINKVEDGKIIPLDMPRSLIRGTMLFRNQDQEFDRLLSKPSADRRIAVEVELFDDHATMTDEDGFTATINIDFAKELAHTHQHENLQRQFSRLGDTIFSLRQLNVAFTKNWFIPSSLLAQWRRTLVEKLMEERMQFYPKPKAPSNSPKGESPIPAGIFPPWGDKRGASRALPYELTHDSSTPLMISRYCLRRQLGICLKDSNSTSKLSDTNPLPLREGRERGFEGLSLRLANGTAFKLQFDCKNCLMKIYKT